ncbi:MAG: NADH-quinone oxidoreductase subunit N [Candidatus Zixiibacteriota bacterium]
MDIFSVIGTVNYSAFAPELVVLGFALLVMVLEPFLPERAKHLNFYLTVLGLLAAAGASLWLWNRSGVNFGGMALSDNFAVFFRLVFLAGTFLVVLVSKNYLSAERFVNGEYYSLLLFSTLGMMFMAGTLDLMVIFLGLEVMSIPLYILAGFRKTDVRSNEAGMKYFLIGAFASSFFLYGIALLYGATGTTHLQEIYNQLPNLQGRGDFLIYAGAALLTVGFAFKVAAVPFHMWAPDVYEGAPTAVTAFMSAGPKAAGFAALLRVFALFLGDYKEAMEAVFWVLAVLTMTVGNVLALVQPNIKRMLAYSSIAHAGYILVAVVAGGPDGVSAALFYLLAYTVMNIGAFAVVLAVEAKESSNQIGDYRGLANRNPYLAAAMTIFMLSLTGIPPTAGFMGKLYIFSAAVSANQIPLVVIAVLNSLVSVYYYLGIVVAMYMHPSPASEKNQSFYSAPLLVVLVLTVLGTLQLGIFPQALLQAASDSLVGLF